jgi:hypothetical protein
MMRFISNPSAKLDVFGTVYQGKIGSVVGVL